MAIPSTQRITPNFTAYELGADRKDATLTALNNIYSTARFLESVRTVLGVPLQVNTPSTPNRGIAARPDNPNSEHPNGWAADFVPLGFPGGDREAYEALRAAQADGRLPPFDQIIFYETSRHIHAGVGPRKRGEFRIALSEGGYPLISADTLARLGAAVPRVVGSVSPWLLIALALGGLFLLALLV